MADSKENLKFDLGVKGLRNCDADGHITETKITFQTTFLTRTLNKVKPKTQPLECFEQLCFWKVGLEFFPIERRKNQSNYNVQSEDRNIL